MVQIKNAYVDENYDGGFIDGIVKEAQEIRV